MARWFAGLLLGAGAVACAHAEAPGVRARVQAVAQAQAQAGFSGAVLVAQDGRMLLDRGYGEIRGEHMRPDTRFWIASIGKQFTSAAIMHCVDMGRLRLDAALSELWPDAPADQRAITIEQILAHTSGLPQSDDAELSANADDARQRIFALPLAAAPGERFQYSNANYQLAAAIVERACGAPYAEVVAEMFDRARLQNTGQIPAAADPHVAPILGERPPRLDALRWGGQGYYSTTRDLYRWREGLREDRVLSASSTRALFAPRAPIQEGHAALGWFIGRTERGAERIFTRGNEDFGANGLIYYYPATQTTIIVLTHAGDRPDGVSWSRAMHAALETALGL